MTNHAQMRKSITGSAVHKIRAKQEVRSRGSMGFAYIVHMQALAANTSLIEFIKTGCREDRL
jgi:hypothetical protein